MKRNLLFVLAAMAVVACSTEKANAPELKYMELGASIEPVTKATIDGSLNTLWSDGDAIKVYVSNNANDWNTVEEFTIHSGVGTPNGIFRSAIDYSSGNHWDYYAYFPYNYTALSGAAHTESNMGGDGFYFCLPESYYNYTSGRSYLPMLANMTGGSAQPTSVTFKFVGGAVILNLKGVPGAAHSLGMKVDGKNIFGWPGKVDLSEVGTAAGKITASDGTDSSVWLNFDGSGDDSRDFEFIFPVPTIASGANLTFTMYDRNGLVIWRKTASNQPAISRAGALIMPELTLNAKPQNMYLIGYLNGADNNTGLAFNNTTGTLTGVTFTQDSYVCLRAADTGNWYMTDTFVSSGSSATMKAQSGDKLKVPAGTYTFTMSYQSNGSIVLSYE